MIIVVSFSSSMDTGVLDARYEQLHHAALYA
jgi:hypothetical protein